MRARFIPVACAVAAIVAGCGGSPHAVAPTTTKAAAPPKTTTQAAAPAQTGPGALQAEAKATAAGDIPDNQVFLVFRNAAAGYAIKYPEGWAQQGSGKLVTFRDKNNIVRIVAGPGGAASTASVHADIAKLRGAQVRDQPRTISIAGTAAVKVVYSTESAPNPVTGKRVELVVDRYYLSSGGRRAVVDLGAPRGVDNVDAYRLMIESFRWS